MEYLTLIEKSPSIITPNFLNVMAYDEAIVDDLYSRFSNATESSRPARPSKTSLSPIKTGSSCCERDL